MGLLRLLKPMSLTCNCARQTLKSKGLNDKGLKDELVKRLARDSAGMPPIETPSAPVSSGGGAAAGGGVAGGGAGSKASGPIGTLIVCPMSVLSNWETQLQEHVKEGALKVSQPTGVDDWEGADQGIRELALK